MQRCINIIIMEGDNLPGGGGGGGGGGSIRKRCINTREVLINVYVYLVDMSS